MPRCAHPARLDVRHHVRRPLLVDVDDHHCLGALVREQCAHGAADPPGASCHERDTLGEQRVVPTTVVVGRIRRVTLIHRRTPPAADGALRRVGRRDCRTELADKCGQGSTDRLVRRKLDVGESRPRGSRQRG